MADIPQVIATYDALVGVALGAGLTYGFGALNRRHQEAREDRTRWYETRLKAYLEYANAAYGVRTLHEESKSQEERRAHAKQLKLSSGCSDLSARPTLSGPLTTSLWRSWKKLRARATIAKRGRRYRASR